jgi:hypothetical protein
MGFFSWKTSDTNRSISNSSSRYGTFPVSMITHDGRRFDESDYEGYGKFGGKDIYELIAEMNGLTDRSEGISLVFADDNVTGDFAAAAKRGVILPKLVENSNRDFDSLPYPEDCPQQGYFYY